MLHFNIGYHSIVYQLICAITSVSSMVAVAAVPPLGLLHLYGLYLPQVISFHYLAVQSSQSQHG